VRYYWYLSIAFPWVIERTGDLWRHIATYCHHFPLIVLEENEDTAPGYRREHPLVKLIGYRHFLIGFWRPWAPTKVIRSCIGLVAEAPSSPVPWWLQDSLHESWPASGCPSHLPGSALSSLVGVADFIGVGVAVLVFLAMQSGDQEGSADFFSFLSLPQDSETWRILALSFVWDHWGKRQVEPSSKMRPCCSTPSSATRQCYQRVIIDL
jgi:hypothetical protein